MQPFAACAARRISSAIPAREARSQDVQQARILAEKERHELTRERFVATEAFNHRVRRPGGVVRRGGRSRSGMVFHECDELLAVAGFEMYPAMPGARQRSLSPFAA